VINREESSRGKKGRIEEGKREKGETEGRGRRRVE
jgi:hypothetical protein